MSLNPIQSGEHVVEQFQPYLLTLFPMPDADMGAQVRENLKRGAGGKCKPVMGRKIRRLREYGTKYLILGYYDAYAAGDLSSWLGPDGKREP